jgi:cell division protein FtsQ
VTTRMAEREPLDVDPRIAARREAVELGRRRRRRRWAGAVAAVVTFVAAGWFLTRTALFDVEQVDVSGAAQTSPDEVRAVSGVVVGDQLLDVDGRRIEQAVGALPWIASVEVGRSLDGVVTIAVRERTPVATVDDGAGGRALVDAEGRVLAPQPLDPAAVDPSWVPVEGVVAPAPGGTLDEAAGPALEVVGRLTPGLRARVAAVRVTPEAELELALRPQGTVDLGRPDQLEEKLVSLVTVLGQVDQDRLSSIDVTVPGLPTVRRT